MHKILLQCIWSDSPSFTEEQNTTSCIQRLGSCEKLVCSSLRASSGISPEVLCLGIVFLLDFCTLVFNKAVMFFPHERKIHLHYVSGWPASTCRLPGSYTGFSSAFNHCPLQFHSPASGLILCVHCLLNRHWFCFSTVGFFLCCSLPVCWIIHLSLWFFSRLLKVACMQLASFAYGGERRWSMR